MPSGGSRSQAKWWVAAVAFVTCYAGGWYATAHSGVAAVTRVLSAERPLLTDIQARAVGPLLVTASFRLDTGTASSDGSGRYLWLPGLAPHVISREGAFVLYGCDF